MGGLGNKIFKAGDIVTAGNFPAGNVPKLIQEGFLKECKETAAEKKERLAKEKSDAKAKEIADAKAKEISDAKKEAEDKK